MVSLAQQVPGYAGHFIDANGNLVVVVSDSSAQGAARAAMAGYLGEGVLGLPARYRHASVSTVVGNYTFQQLCDWRDDVFDHILAKTAGVLSLDLDEKRNRVTIGILQGQFESIKSEVTAQLEALGIPLAAVNFRSQSAWNLASARRIAMLSSSDGTIAGLVDTVGGGDRLLWQSTDGNYHNCSVGFVVEKNSAPYFVTAGHCASNYLTGATPDEFFQPTTPDSLGLLALDPAWTYCNLGDACAYKTTSDAMLVAITQPHRPWRRGMIARTTQRAYDGGATLQIDGIDPWFAVDGVEQSLTTGVEVQKVGNLSGWTYGNITATCEDEVIGVIGSEWVTQCQGRADLWGQNGDSGGPVFGWDGADAATLYGIIVGLDCSSVSGTCGDNGYEGAFFTTYQELYAKLGPFNALSDISVGTPSVSGSFDGTTEAPVVSWSGVTTSGNGVAGHSLQYQVYRQIYDYTNPTMSSSWLDIATSTSGPSSYTDSQFGGSWAPYQYLGTTGPPNNQSYVAYFVRAYYSGVYQDSPVIYYLFNDPNGGCGQFVC